MKLGAGPEALAGYAEGAVGIGRASSGSVYAAARRIVQAQPYNAAAHNVLGLACEARGDFGGAVRAYSAGLDVCTDHHDGWLFLLLLVLLLCKQEPMILQQSRKGDHCLLPASLAAHALRSKVQTLQRWNHEPRSCLLTRPGVILPSFPPFPALH